ncbi:Rieske 2Fe-2S domain-containing protein [Pirellulaceae bacterium]|jgi:nitrite reductase (NADH) small subunit/3-phenylpropionate/trans-cinnamate dioxygenase ferredoxin subunit|nr:Rieske 2Fe-2S domain-containing protein [Pirellulaceae bacterium]
MAQFHSICKKHDVPIGSARMFVVNEIPIGIFHVDGEFFALDNRCPHAGASLSLGTMDRDTVSCRIHHWHFCLRDGTYLDENRPEFDARCFPVRLKGDEVQVQV